MELILTNFRLVQHFFTVSRVIFFQLFSGVQEHTKFSRILLISNWMFLLVLNFPTIVDIFFIFIRYSLIWFGAFKAVKEASMSLEDPWAFTIQIFAGLFCIYIYLHTQLYVFLNIYRYICAHVYTCIYIYCMETAKKSHEKESH